MSEPPRHIDVPLSHELDTTSVHVPDSNPGFATKLESPPVACSAVRSYDPTNIVSPSVAVRFTLAPSASYLPAASVDGSPVIFDDALGCTDPQRLARTGAAISTAADDCQVIILPASRIATLRRERPYRQYSTNLHPPFP